MKSAYFLTSMAMLMFLLAGDELAAGRGFGGGFHGGGGDSMEEAASVAGASMGAAWADSEEVVASAAAWVALAVQGACAPADSAELVD